MCYHVKITKESQLEKSNRLVKNEDDLFAIDQLVAETDLPLYHVSGFQHPKILIYTNESPNYPVVAHWGLIPDWVRDETQKNDIWNKTLNARSESIFEKPSFQASAVSKRCIIYLDGFYEYHYHRGKSYPYYIYQKSKEPMAIAGLFNSWTDPMSNEIITTFSIVTTKGNEFMTKIHNNPKLKEPRMPLMLNKSQEENWLFGVEKASDMSAIQNDNQHILCSHTVRPLSGKHYIGNIPMISNNYNYPDLNPLLLF